MGELQIPKEKEEKKREEKKKENEKPNKDKQESKGHLSICVPKPCAVELYVLIIWPSISIYPFYLLHAIISLSYPFFFMAHQQPKINSK